jgi:hypothetical protein
VEPRQALQTTTTSWESAEFEPSPEIANALEPVPSYGIDFEAIGKFIALITVAFYGVGLIVVNFHLYRLGFSDFSLLRSRFVLTGAVALLPATPIFLTVLAIWIFFRDRTFSGIKLRSLEITQPLLWIVTIAFLIYLLISIVMMPAVLIYFNIVEINLLSDWIRPNSAAVFVLISMAVNGSLGACYLYEKVASMRFHSWKLSTNSELPVGYLTWLIEGRRMKNALVWCFWTFLVVFFFLNYLFAFSMWFVPVLPEQIGGARPKWTQLILFRNSAAEARQLGLQFQESGSESSMGLRTVPVVLLWEGEHSYLLYSIDASSQAWSVQLSKELVAGVISVERHLTWPGPSDGSLGSATPPPLDSRLTGTPVGSATPEQ